MNGIWETPPPSIRDRRSYAQDFKREGMSLFRSRKDKVESLLGEYRDEIVTCMDSMVRTVKSYCQEPDPAKLEEHISEVNRAESRCDDIRREIEVLLYSKALFPESRGDMLGLLESMDRVPNEAESAVNMIKTHHIQIPSEFQMGIVKLTEVSRRCVLALLEAEERLYTRYQTAVESIGRVDELESEADVLELTLTEQIFGGHFKIELDALQKILLRDLIQKLAAVSDRAENVADRIRIIVAKRSI